MNEQRIRRALAGKLREFRLSAGLTAKEVGEKIGKSEKTVSAWEHGRGQPDADMLFMLCEIYKIKSMAEFYSDDAPEQKEEPVLQSDDEQELLRLYRLLNRSGQEALLLAAQSFATNPDLKKEASNTAMA